MPALTFYNTTNQSKFSGKINYEGKIFEYDIYLLPSKNKNEINEIIERISSRKRYSLDGKESVCLGLDKNKIKEILDDDDASAFGFVKESGTQDEGSGSLQIYNWCSLKRKYNTEYDISQIWINDVCRYTIPGTPKSTISPIKVLFTLFEQLTTQILGMNEIYLMVEPNEYPILGTLYKKYGFDDVSFENCKKNKGRQALKIMKKYINKNPNYDNFPFVEPTLQTVQTNFPETSLSTEHISIDTSLPLMNKIGGKKQNKKLKTKKRKTNKRKTNKRKK
jgi:hypothetical protein